MLNKIILANSKHDADHLTFTPVSYNSGERVGWASHKHGDRIPYWVVNGENVTLSEVGTSNYEKIPGNFIYLNGYIDFDLTVSCKGYERKFVVPAGDFRLITDEDEDPWEFLSMTEKTLMFTPPQTVIYRKNKENPTLCKEGRINVYQECNGSASCRRDGRNYDYATRKFQKFIVCIPRRYVQHGRIFYIRPDTRNTYCRYEQANHCAKRRICLLERCGRLYGRRKAGAVYDRDLGYKSQSINLPFERREIRFLTDGTSSFVRGGYHAE